MKSWWICAFVLEIYSNYVDSYDTMPKSHLHVINLIFDNNQTKNMQCLIVIVLVCKSLYKCSCDLYLRPINIFETFSSVIFLPLFIETELYVDEKILSWSLSPSHKAESLDGFQNNQGHQFRRTHKLNALPLPTPNSQLPCLNSMPAPSSCCCRWNQKINTDLMIDMWPRTRHPGQEKIAKQSALIR